MALHVKSGLHILMQSTVLWKINGVLMLYYILHDFVLSGSGFHIWFLPTLGPRCSPMPPVPLVMVEGVPPTSLWSMAEMFRPKNRNEIFTPKFGWKMWSSDLTLFSHQKSTCFFPRWSVFSGFCGILCHTIVGRSLVASTQLLWKNGTRFPADFTIDAFLGRVEAM